MLFVLIALVIILLPFAAMTVIVMVICHRDQLAKEYIVGAIHNHFKHN